VEQHLPATHAFDWQSCLATQLAPFAFLAAVTHAPSVHISAPPQLLVADWQAPPSLQVRSVCLSAPLQLALPQSVPAFSRRQPPPPSQPSAQASSRHWPDGSAPPAGMLLQTPSLPARLQARQVPSHAVAQHRPWAQVPLAQSSPLPHRAPFSRLPQLPAAQPLPSVHWASLPQLTAQRFPSHPANGAHDRGGGV
jgi:hypothetical protein